MIPLCLYNVISIVFCSCSDQVGAKRSHAFALARQWWRNTMLPDTKTCQYACVGIGIPGNLAAHALWDFRSHYHYIKGVCPRSPQIPSWHTREMTVVMGSGRVPGPTVLTCLDCTLDNWYLSWLLVLQYIIQLIWVDLILYLYIFECTIFICKCTVLIAIYPSLFRLPTFKRNKV